MSKILIDQKEQIVTRGHTKAIFLGREFSIIVERSKLGGHSVIDYPVGRLGCVHIEGVTDSCELWRKNAVATGSEVTKPKKHSADVNLHESDVSILALNRGSRRGKEEAFV